jgi:hypothetical protein
MHEGDAAGGVVDAVAFAAAVTQDVLPLHVREGVLDAGAHPFVDGVECVLVFAEKYIRAGERHSAW